MAFHCIDAKISSTVVKEEVEGIKRIPQQVLKDSNQASV